jgi:hypothetical protein
MRERRYGGSGRVSGLAQETRFYSRGQPILHTHERWIQNYNTDIAVR